MPNVRTHGVLTIGRFLVAMLAVLVSGWLLAAARGVAITMQDHASGWPINELPRRPIATIVVFLTVGLLLPFLSAWLTRPGATDRIGERLDLSPSTTSYTVRLMIAMVAAVLVAGILPFLALALADAGII